MNRAQQLAEAAFQAGRYRRGPGMSEEAQQVLRDAYGGVDTIRPEDDHIGIARQYGVPAWIARTLSVVIEYRLGVDTNTVVRDTPRIWHPTKPTPPVDATHHGMQPSTPWPPETTDPPANGATPGTSS